ncbi:unnamed protein product [Brachionus calyciflorus]|uniref:Protein phosphatase n=1 Tax=Brachionus calyciflorus TaxID=104777 RepID=A0A813X8B2_9BILA|nr:unnamed protein product [Brachionus calyciflorus]
MVNCNLDNQKPVEIKSHFTKNADKAFDEFCKQYLNKSNGQIETKNQNMSSPCYIKVGSKTLRINSSGKVLNTVCSNTLMNESKSSIIDEFVNRLDKNFENENFNFLFSQKNNFEPLKNSFQQSKPDPPPRPIETPPPRPPPTYLKEEPQKYYFYNNSSDIFINTSKSDLDDNNYLFEIPKKNKFRDEFYSKSRHSINQQISSIFTHENKENEFKSLSSFSRYSLSPYIVNSNTEQYLINQPISKPKLGLSVVSCGMNKKGRLPIPQINFLIDKGDFGDDAGFVAQNLIGDALGIADGATGNCMLGYDPGDFSRKLMQYCSEIYVEEDKTYDAKTLLLDAYEKVQNDECYGSCTACVLTLNHSTNILTAANVGDTGYLILRNAKIVYQSVPQRINFECPRQLDSYPWKEPSRRMGISYTDIAGQFTELKEFEVIKDDIIILSSDGLFDNLEPYEIEEICSKSKSLMDAAENLVFRSVKYYRKPDDILVLIAKIVENKPLSYLNKYSIQTKSV